MGDFWEEIIKARTVAQTAVKADMNSLITQIDSYKQNLDSAQTKDQLDTAINNQKYFQNRAGRYKKTKVYADTVANNAENKLNDYKMFETAIMSAGDYLSDTEFMDKKEEWVDLHSLAKKREYDSVMDFIKFEQDQASRWMQQLANSDGRGGPVPKGFRYNKHSYGTDMAILNKLSDYQRQLAMAMQGVMLDGVLQEEEALFAYAADAQGWEKYKTRKIKEAVNQIESSRFDTAKYTKWINSADSGGFKSVFGSIPQQELDAAGMNYNVGNDGTISSTETEQSFVEKLQNLRRQRKEDGEIFENIYHLYDGMPFGGTKSGVQVDEDEVPQMEWGKDAEGKQLVVEGLSGKDSDNDGIPDSIDSDTADSEVPISETEPKDISREEKLKQDYIEENWVDNIHPEAKDDFKKWFNEDGDMWAGVKWQSGSSKERYKFKGAKDFVTAKSNQFKERDSILDGSDKASSSINKFLKGEVNMTQAMTEGKHSDSKRTTIVGKKARKKLRNFQIKFKNSGLNIEDFISQNSEEYYQMTLLLKYGDYWIKNIKSIASNDKASDRSNIEFYKDLYK